MIKIGVIGCGFMGGMHTACYEALENMGVKVVAVADIRRSFAEKLMKAGTEYYETGMELIEKADVDVVDICLPTDLHTAHAVAAMKKGINVYVEKPVCLTEDEMTLLLQTEKETGVKVQVGQVVRHMAKYKWLKQTVDSGIYGRILSGEFTRISARPEWAGDNWLHTVSRSGGVAIDMHVHDVDFVRYLLGDPDRVQAQASRDSEGVIQHINALYGYGSDVGIAVQAGWDYPATFPFTAEYRVKFEKATVVNSGDVTVYPIAGEPFNPKIEEDFSGSNDIGGNISSLAGYYGELKYFIEGLQGKNDLSVATLQEAVASARLAWREVAAAGGLIQK